MGKNSNPRFAAPRRGGSLLTGILVGMVVGLLIAGGVAWYILKTPSSFVENVTHDTKKLKADSYSRQLSDSTAAINQVIDVPTPASGVEDGKPRFEFYKVLTDKQDATVSIPKSSENSVMQEKQPVPNQTAGNVPAEETYFLQAGSFPNAVDADNLKAKLAILGIEASVQVVTVPDKGVWHRVHIGPYKGREEVKNALAILKQNGISATPMLAH